MKAHNFFAEGSFKKEEEVRTMMRMYSCLVGHKVKAESTKESPEDKDFEDEVFTIVGLTTKRDDPSIHAVLKSDECDITITVSVDMINRPRDTYFYDPGFILKLIKE